MFIESTPSSVSSYMSGTARLENVAPQTLTASRANLSKYAAEQALDLQWWIPHPDGEGGKSSPSPASPQPQPPAPHHSGRMTKGKALLPLHPLDIKIGADQPRGTKRSAAVAGHIDEMPNEDQGGDSEPGPRKMVTLAGRRRTTRVRFQSPLESPPSQRHRVGDDLETAETSPDGLWVAMGEDRCKPCKLVGREVCKPQWNASKICKPCVFCTGQSWSCNPPDSWLEKAATELRLKQARPKTHEDTTDDAPIEVGESPETAEPASSTTEVEVVKHQSRPQKGSKAAQATLDHEARLPTSAPARGRRKGGPVGRECAAQPPHLALPVTESSALLVGGRVGGPEFDRGIAVLFWRAELARAIAAYEAAVAYVEFVQEQYEQVLKGDVATHLSMAVEPRVKRAKTNTPRNGKR
ncbi:hypothetical protein BJY52DRAFT_1270679 [Lactarius psammicola]|nr:hypothetical protein BJY52DRAFT_1270679 [Lactarius psammicola]